MFGVHEAAILMDRPPGGWPDLATNRSVDALAAGTGRRFDEMAAGTGRRFDEMAAEMNRRFGEMAAEMNRRFAEMATEMDRRFAEQDERLGLRLDALEHKILGAMERAFRGQTWRLVTAMAAFMGIFAAVVKV
jgi:hypothetical protein